MAADVVFTAERPWYTNSVSWHQIMDCALRDLEGPARQECQGYKDTRVVDLAGLPDGKAAEVARWLSGVIERMLAEGEAELSEERCAHMRELVRRLHSEMRIRGSARA